MKRRHLLPALAATPWAMVHPVGRAHAPFGRVEPPRMAPALPLRGGDGRWRDLAGRLRGHATAVQLMFTGCSAVCPLQGALFGAVSQRLGEGGGRLLSLSIDPVNDEPAALAAWLARHGAGPAWQAAAPRHADVDRLFEFTAGRAAGVDRHTAQVFFFDRQARLVYRSPELPRADHVLETLRELARR